MKKHEWRIAFVQYLVAVEDIARPKTSQNLSMESLLPGAGKITAPSFSTGGDGLKYAHITHIFFLIFLKFLVWLRNSQKWFSPKMTKNKKKLKYQNWSSPKYD